jgi:hypothetical protein
VATLRQEMVELLAGQEMTALALSRELRVREKEVYEHLPHIARSLAAQGRRLLVRPAQCLSCGYVFESRRRLTRPSRCPMCKSTHLQSPAYRIGNR